MAFRLLPSCSILLSQLSAAQSPPPKAIPDESVCARCTISTRPVVTFGADDGVGSLNGKPMSVNIDSRGRYWLFLELEPPTVFSADGKVDRMIGRKGAGPGEFQSANSGVVVGDSMLVFDWMGTRATMIGPDLKAGRMIRTTHGLGDIVLLTWPTHIVTVAHMTMSDPPNSTIHRFSVDGSEFRLRGSFGPRGTGGSMGNVEVNQRVGRSRDGLWSAYWNRPQFTKWNRNGVIQSQFTRSFDWYTGETKATLGWGRTPPTPMTALINEDESGLVWLFIYRPVDNWEDAWVDVKPIRIGGGSEIRMRDVAYDKLFNTYVEVIDPAQARVVARHTINGYVFQALPDRKVAKYLVDFNGIPRVQILQLLLNGR